MFLWAVCCSILSLPTVAAQHPHIPKSHNDLPNRQRLHHNETSSSKHGHRPKIHYDEVVTPRGFWNTNDVWKAWCLQDEWCIPKKKCSKEQKIAKSDWTVCMDSIEEARDCLVYSIGIANEWAFDAALGRMGCEVHAFDPTINHPTNLAPNVTFHKVGLYGGESNNTSIDFKSAGDYGAVEGKLYTFKDLVQLMGHEKRKITILKIDCEGCEWEVFGSPGIRPRHFHNVQQLLVEFHFSKRLQVATIDRVKYIGRTFDNLLADDPSVPAEEGRRSFSRFFFTYNTGIRPDLPMIKEFTDYGGFPDWACCRVVGFLRA